jgi:hypothetical protein
MEDEISGEGHILSWNWPYTKLAVTSVEKYATLEINEHD